MIKKIFLTFFLLVSSSFGQSNIEVRNYFQQTPTASYFLRSIYQARNFEPLFGKSGQWQLSSADLESIGAGLRSHGLNPGDYNFQAINEVLKKNKISNLKLELFISDLILKSLIHVAVGRIDPRKISADIKYAPKEFMLWSTFSSLTPAQIPMTLDQLAPKNKLYQGLRRVLAKLNEWYTKKLWKPTPLPDGTITHGHSHPIVSLVKEKLNLLGYNLINTGTLYDAPFDTALKSIQADLSIPFETGLAKNSKVWRILNTDLKSRIHETELQLEKTRWLPNELESRYALANLASQIFTVNDFDLNQNAPVIEFKLSGGAAIRKSPSMEDKITSITLNPSWAVSIDSFFNEKLPLIKNDLNFFKKNGYRVINLRSDLEVDPKTINWNLVNRSTIDFQIIQNPGTTNALGVAKFSMTNKYSVYLGDTSDKNSFKSNYRLSGPSNVRLEKPLELAEYLLANTEWNRSRLEGVIAKPGQKLESETKIPVTQPLSVYILSLTVQESGSKIRFFEDYYGQNNSLFKKLQQH